MSSKNTQNSSTVKQVSSHIEKKEFEKAMRLAKKYLQEDNSNIDVLRMLAFCQHCLGLKLDHLKSLQTVFEVTTFLLDKEAYMSALIDAGHSERALELKTGLMLDPSYKKGLKQLMIQGQPLGKRTHQFYFAATLKVLKKELSDLALSTIPIGETRARADGFISNLFDLGAFYRTAEEKLHRPSYIAYAGLNNQPYIEQEEVISIEKLSNVLPKIKQLVLQIIETNHATPYVKDLKGAPKGMEHLKANMDWSSLSIYECGNLKIKGAEELISLLKSHFELAHFPPMAPEIMISILQPDTHITPHFGITNIKQTLHIPILLPDGDIGIRVGGIEKRWKDDGIILFDDSFEHEAWNRSKSIRIVLILDVWHPSLSTEERIFIQNAYPKIAAWRSNVEL